MALGCYHGFLECKHYSTVSGDIYGVCPRRDSTMTNCMTTQNSVRFKRHRYFCDFPFNIFLMMFDCGNSSWKVKAQVRESAV